ncbi:MAG: hypothetical protein IJS15_06180 [Victivallales bacterium]|nr:hypothetical protein [Victivallales bacterium]
MLTALVILIIVGLIWTTTGVVMGGVARKGVSVEAMQCMSYLLGTLTCFALLPLYPSLEVGGKFAWFAIGMYFLVGVLNYFVNVTMTAAMKRGPNSLVWAILQAGMIMPFMVGLCFHDVPAGAVRLVGMAAMIAALALLSLDKNDASGATGRSWLFLAFVTFLIVGVQQTVATEPSYYPETRTGIPAIYRCLALCGGNLVATIPYILNLVHKGGVKGIRDEFSGKWLWLFAITLQASILIEKLFLSFRAMDMMAKLGRGCVSYPVMVVSCIAGFTIYSMVFLREKISWRSAGGLLLCAIGIVMLSL